MQTLAVTQAGAAEMTSTGIVQEPNSILHTKCESYDLPAESDLAQTHFNQLRNVATKVFKAHPTNKCLGVAAPQIGIGRRIAIMRPYDSDEIRLLNASIVERSNECDIRFEGCLSLFDVRGRIARPLSIVVEAQDFDGRMWRRAFTNATARLICHELDHLDGLLYVDSISEELLPVDEYRMRTDTDWIYDNRMEEPGGK